MILQGRKILLGVTGSIAAYKACELVRLLVREGAAVQVVMTAAAEQFVSALTFEALSRRPARTDLFDREAEAAMSHIELARWADVVLIAPATADCVARLAQGQADDLLTTLCLATRAPIAVAPAMNQAMWENPATEEHIQTLSGRGIRVLPPDCGEQACGEIGPGRLSEPEVLLDAVAELCGDRTLDGIHAIVTAGPTREAIDPARFLSNFSTGRMGCALAQALQDRGARTTLIHGPVSAPLPAVDECIGITSAEEMFTQAQTRLDSCQLFVACAAVADWRPKKHSAKKIQKESFSGTLELEPTPDLLAHIGGASPRPYLVGFAAETENLTENARAKLRAKGADLIVANRIGADLGFGDQPTTLEVVDADSVTVLGPGPKPDLARQLADHIAARLPEIPSSVVDFPNAVRRSTHSG